jgi:RNA polymerase sigma-70 factor (ECF subfamily)
MDLLAGCRNVVELSIYGERRLAISRDKMSSYTGEVGYADLINRISLGDQEALPFLYDATNRLVFGLVLRILGDRSAAEDVLIEVYTQVWQQAGRFDGTRGGPISWMLAIARSRAIDRLRADKELRRFDRLSEIDELQTDIGTSPDRATAESEMGQIVRSALEALSVEDRKIIECAYYSGMSHSEIALHLGLPLGTVKTRIRRGMTKLRDLLSPTLMDQI